MAGSMPISGASANFCCFGAEPSSGGNGVDIARNPSVHTAPIAYAHGMSNATPNTPALDLDAIEQEIINVETALERLAAGTYFVDEITGSALADDVLAADPTARHA